MSKESPLKILNPMAIAQGVGGLASIAGGLIGRKDAMSQLAADKRNYDTNIARFSELDTSNPYADMENVYEDLTVNTQAADFTAQQQAQGMANTMDQFKGAAGGSGIAALAQAMAQQQSTNAQRASVDIGQQERSNQTAERSAAGQLQQMERQGDVMSRNMERQKTVGLLGLAGDQLAASRQNIQARNQAIMSGIGQLAGGAAGLGQLVPEAQEKNQLP